MVFHKKKKSYGLLAYTGILVAITIFFVTNITRMEKENFDKSCHTLTEAVRKAAVNCYAIEGQYPDNLDYLLKNYGLSYDTKKFMVHYELIGSNLMPDIFVTGSEEFYEGN